MGTLQSKALMMGICLPTARLINQGAYSLDLAESDEPELASVGWNSLHTESTRRIRARLQRALMEPPVQEEILAEASPAPASLVKDERGARIFDIYRQARDLIDTVSVYHGLAYEDPFQERWDVNPVLPVRAGLTYLHAVLRSLRDAELTVQLRRNALSRVGLPPSISHRIRVVRGGLEWGIFYQAAALESIEVGGDIQRKQVAIQKGELYGALLRLNRMGYLAYRHDPAHRARYNMGVLEGHQPSLGIEGRVLPFKQGSALG